MPPELSKTSGLLLAETFHCWRFAKKVDRPKYLHQSMRGPPSVGVKTFFFFFSFAVALPNLDQPN